MPGCADYGSMGLSGEITASSFCKAANSPNKEVEDFDKADRAKSLLHMISNDIGQLAYLYAKLNDCKRVIFGGFFIRGHPATMHTVSFGINYWSKGTMTPLFLRHEGYLGAIGAFMQSPRFKDSNVWGENFASSSGYREKSAPEETAREHRKSFSMLELDMLDIPCDSFPYIVEPYKADHWDLTDDLESRTYWLDTLINSTEKTVKIAIESQPGSQDAIERSVQFSNRYICRLNELRTSPGSYGRLTVRKLLNMKEDLLNELGFPDPYLAIKKQENEYFLSSLSDRLMEVDNITDPCLRR